MDETSMDLFFILFFEECLFQVEQNIKKTLIIYVKDDFGGEELITSSINLLQFEVLLLLLTPLKRKASAVAV